MFALITLQVLSSHIGLVATVLDSAIIEHPFPSLQKVLMDILGYPTPCWRIWIFHKGMRGSFMVFKQVSWGCSKVKVLVAQCCLTLCNPMDPSPPGSSVHGLLQARILEWVAIPSPGDLPHPGIEPRSPTLQADSWGHSHWIFKKKTLVENFI